MASPIYSDFDTQKLKDMGIFVPKSDLISYMNLFSDLHNTSITLKLGFGALEATRKKDGYWRVEISENRKRIGIQIMTTNQVHQLLDNLLLNLRSMP